MEAQARPGKILRVADPAMTSAATPSLPVRGPDGYPLSPGFYVVWPADRETAASRYIGPYRYVDIALVTLVRLRRAADGADNVPGPMPRRTVSFGD
ncbi:MAG: hypothetical protein ACOZDY_14970 [Pseudomonadota bacterium]